MVSFLAGEARTLALGNGAAREMKGSKCKCGFATTSIKTRCPRCGREMKPSEWEEKGRVLSFVGMQVVPEGLDHSYDAALVGIDNEGPKIICWTADRLEVNDEVAVSESKGKYMCSPRPEAKEESSKTD